ncbi:MAG: hypothetical protein IJ209_03420 [Bacteroidaceae bacterium]|nr:hypothetical protein [Bacteroidaceae bacterium]
MKYSLFALLVLCGFLSCSKDDVAVSDASHTPDGTFVSVIDGYEVMIVEVQGGQCHSFVLWQSDGKQLMFSGFDTEGVWPNYTYSTSTFQMSATYNSDATEFTADYSGVMKSDYITIAFDAKGVKFSLNRMPLDENMDGVPDVLQ